MAVTKIEQETIINYNQAETEASIYTHDPRMIRKMAQLAQKHKGIALIREGDGWVEYTFPKKWVKVNAPKQYSEEQRQLMAERARERFGKKEGITVGD